MENVIEDVGRQIAGIVNPLKIILSNRKIQIDHSVKSFDLCVIMPDGTDKKETLRQIYRLAECPLPFGVTVYLYSEWELLKRDDQSYTSVLNSRGTVLYEKR